MSQSSPVSRLSYLSAALQDRRALLLGYVKNDVVTQDRLALLWTIEAVCDDSLSRAPETHPVLLHLLQSPPMGRTTAPCLKSWPWLVPRYALLADAPGLRALGGCGARLHAWAVCEISPFCPTNHTHTRQQTHASNPCGYDKAPKVVAFGNGCKEGISLKDTAKCR